MIIRILLRPFIQSYQFFLKQRLQVRSLCVEVVKRSVRTFPGGNDGIAFIDISLHNRHIQTIIVSIEIDTIRILALGLPFMYIRTRVWKRLVSSPTLTPPTEIWVYHISGVSIRTFNSFTKRWTRMPWNSCTHTVLRENILIGFGRHWRFRYMKRYTKSISLYTYQIMFIIFL